MPLFQKKPPSDTTSAPNTELPRQKKKRGWARFSFDMSVPAQRRKALAYLFFLIVAALAFPVVAVEAYTFSESTEFCGTLCHSMDPQFAQHNISAHSNVECAACHIGPGVDHFIRSKITGTRQLFDTLSNSYSLPIKGPVKDLRPARETCETCHNPVTFKDNIIKTIVHYDNDKDNSKLQTTLVLKMGGTQQDTGVSKGIHWHISSKMYYIPTDEQRQVIAWVGVEQADGSLKEYFSRDLLNADRKAFVDQARAADQVRSIDCIDCHNRTAHYVQTPEELVDKSLSSNRLSASIPFIRSKVVELLRKKFPTRAEADTAIDGLAAFYKQNYPGVVAGKLDATLAEVKNLYAGSSYPEMKLYWDTNPNFERHIGESGCFRCHDDKHINVDATGKAVETVGVECNSCHSVPITSKGSEISVNTPIIGGSPPASHSDFRWTLEHRSVTEMQKQECYQCHGVQSCNNSVCHGVSHPDDMLYSHPTQFDKSGAQACYMCHQDILCSRCHVDINTNGYTKVTSDTVTAPGSGIAPAVRPAAQATGTVTKTNSGK